MALGVAELLGDWLTASRRNLRSRQARLALFRVAVVASGLFAAWISDAAPTGYPTLDKVYVALLAGTVSYYAGTARRWTWFLPAGIGAVLAGDVAAVGLAAAALCIGFWSVLSDTRTPARSAIVVGVGFAAALRAGPVGFHGATALLVGVCLVPVVVSGYRNAGHRVRHRSRQLAAVVGALLGLTVAGAVVAMVTVGGDLVRGMELADEGIVAARDANDEVATQRLAEASRLLSATSSTLEGWFVRPARGLPLLGPNLRAVERLTDDVGELAGVTSAAASASDVDQLRFSKGRLPPDTVANVASTLEDVARSVRRVQVSVDEISSPWLVAPVSDRVDTLSAELTENLPDVSAALDAARIGHGLLAPKGSRTYLVLFVTPTEARGRSGFPGNYAELQVEDGQLSMPRFGRISELEDGVPGVTRTISGPGTEDYLARYGPFDPQNTWRNITMSPDLPTIARVAGQLYPQSGGRPVDGVMTVDPAGLAALLHFTNPVSVPEIPAPLTAANAEDFLNLDQYVVYPEASERIDVLGSVAEQTFRQLLAADLPEPKEFVDVLSPVVKGGHIQFTTTQLVEQQYFTNIGLSGALDTSGGQVLSVVTNNAGGNKLDLFLHRSVRYEAIYDPATNVVGGKITVELQNTAEPDSTLPNYVVGNMVGLPEGTNRSYVSVYSSHQLDAARLNGQPAGLQVQNELGVYVYSTFVDIPPKGTVTIELDVHGVQMLPGFYSMKLLPQPLVEPDLVDFTLTVAGDEPLEADAEGAELTENGRTLHWNGPLDQPVEAWVDTTGQMTEQRLILMNGGPSPEQ